MFSFAEVCWTALGHDPLVLEAARPGVESDLWSGIFWRCRYKLTAKSGQCDSRAQEAKLRSRLPFWP